MDFAMFFVIEIITTYRLPVSERSYCEVMISLWISCFLSDSTVSP